MENPSGLELGIYGIDSEVGGRHKKEQPNNDCSSMKQKTGWRKLDGLDGISI